MPSCEFDEVLKKLLPKALSPGGRSDGDEMQIADWFDL